LFKPKIEIRSMTSNAYFQLFMQQRLSFFELF